MCPNCQSKEVIKVQDQWFCTGCGQLILTAAEAHEAASETLAADLPAGVTMAPEMAAVISNHSKPTAVRVANTPPETKVPKKRKVGRPKAVRLDTPLEPALSELPSVAPAEVAAPALKPVTKVAKTEAAVGRSMNDIAPRTVTEPVALANDAPPLAAAPTKPAKPAVHHPALDYSQVEAESWSQRWHPKYAFAFAMPAVLLALLVGWGAAILTHGTAAEMLKVTQANIWSIGGEIVLVLALYYLSQSLASSALIFRIARDADHRPAPRSRWWGVAINSFGARFRLDLSVVTMQVFGLALIAALVYTGGTAWSVPEYVQLGALALAFMVMLYLVAGLGLAQILGHVGVTLGVVPARRALALGWDFFRHHFDLLGARLLSLLVELALVVPFIAAVIALTYLGSDYYRWAIVAVVMLGVVTVGMLSGAGGAIWWQAVYRRLVRNERITEVMNLLAGRHAERAKRGPLVFIVALFVIIFSLAVAWPWLPTPTF